MPTVELIAIGTELLLGEINDTNTRYIARQLRDCGLDLYRSTTVGDNLQRITSLMKESLSRADIVITTGGLGPTVDDPTRDAAAQAFNSHNEFHPELWEQIQQRFQKRAITISENNKKQAMIPSDATVIQNPVGTAPAFILSKNNKTLVCLPGVPREMEYLMQSDVIPWLKEHYPLAGVIKAKVLHIAAMSESKVDELVGDLETMTNPSVGLLAHPGIVDIRITAKADSIEEADRMIKKVESEVRHRFGDDIYGEDHETLASSIHQLADKLIIPIKIWCSGFSKDTFTTLEHKKLFFEYLDKEDVDSRFSMDLISKESEVNPLLVSCYTAGTEICKLECAFYHGSVQEKLNREYMGAPGLREEWAANYFLNFIRLQLIKAFPRGDK